MASALKNLVETKVEKSLGGNAVDLLLCWREAGIHWRSIQAETYRIAALVAEASQDERWCVDVRADCGILGHGLLGTYIRLELADATDAESSRAAVILLSIQHDIRR